MKQTRTDEGTATMPEITMKQTRTDEGTATMSELEKSNPRLARRAKMAQLIASRLDSLVPNAGDLVSASNWPDESRRRRRKTRRRRWRLAPMTQTERTLLTMRNETDVKYAVRATVCGRAFALRAAWPLHDDGKKGPKIQGHSHLPLLLTGTALATRERVDFTFQKWSTLSTKIRLSLLFLVSLPFIFLIRKIRPRRRHHHHRRRQVAKKQN